MSKRVAIHYRLAGGRSLADLDFEPCCEAGLDDVIGGVVLRNSDAARIATTSDGQRSFADNGYCFGEVAVFRKLGA